MVTLDIIINSKRLDTQTIQKAKQISLISKIEVALRVRLVEALLVHGDVLILQHSPILFCNFR